MLINYNDGELMKAILTDNYSGQINENTTLD
jgi:hypothetical protein